MAPTDFGMYALYHSRLDNDPTLFFHMEYMHENLISLAAKQGYDTWMVGGSSWFFQDHINSYRDLFHFSHYEAMESMRRHYPKDQPRIWTWGYPDDIVLKDAARILELQKKRRTFMVVKLCNTHNPYYCNPQGAEQPLEDGQAREQVLCSIESDDQAMAGFLADLRQKNLWDEHTLLVLTGDHSPAFKLDYENVLHRDFEPLDWLPIAFITPNQRPWRRLDKDTLCSQLDLAPTLLPLMGSSAPAYFMGRDLLATRGPGSAVGSFNGQISLRTQAGQRFLVRRDPTENEEDDETLAESALRKWLHNYESAAVFGRKSWNSRRPSWQYSGSD
jgi:phosphoglycerol transferase MdoB-like AlkP superfamily enzyme